MKFCIAKYRKHLGLSQAALAEAVGVKRAVIGFYETGRASPSAKVLVALSRVLGVSMEELIEESSDTAQQTTVEV